MARARATSSPATPDAALVLEKVVPVALKKGKPGTPEFRAALKDAVENDGPHRRLARRLTVTKDNHWGFTTETGVILKVVNGDWKVVTTARPIAAAGAGPLRRTHGLLDRQASSTLDGVTNGAVYALLAYRDGAGVRRDRVIFIPQGEFVAFGALTLALLQTGRCRARSGCC